MLFRPDGPSRTPQMIYPNMGGRPTIVQIHPQGRDITTTDTKSCRCTFKAQLLRDHRSFTGEAGVYRCLTLMKWWSALGIVESRGFVRTYWLFCESMSMLNPRSSSTSFCWDLFFLFPPFSSSSSTLNTASTFTPFIYVTDSVETVWTVKQWWMDWRYHMTYKWPVCCCQRHAPRSPLPDGLLPSWHPPGSYPVWSVTYSELRHSSQTPGASLQLPAPHTPALPEGWRQKLTGYTGRVCINEPSNQHTQDFVYRELVVKQIFLECITCVLITVSFFLLFNLM